jgi:hypothetical protein
MDGAVGNTRASPVFVHVRIFSTVLSFIDFGSDHQLNVLSPSHGHATRKTDEEGKIR